MDVSRMERRIRRSTTTSAPRAGRHRSRALAVAGVAALVVGLGTGTAGAGGRIPLGEPADAVRPVTASTDAAPAPLERTRRQSLPHGGRHRAPILRQPAGQIALRDGRNESKSPAASK